MTADTRAAVLTARRAAQHFRLSVPHDAYEYLCILSLLPEPSPVSALCWQMHRLLTVLVSLLRVWVHCPRASNGPLPRRSNLVGYVQWDAQFDRFLLVKQSLTSSFQVTACDGTHGLIYPPCQTIFPTVFQVAVCFASCIGSINGLECEHRRKVCSVSGDVMLSRTGDATSICAITAQHSLPFALPYPHRHCPPHGFLPHVCGERYGFTLFRWNDVPR